jgi:ferredoxin--NADP+ reductase
MNTASLQTHFLSISGGRMTEQTHTSKVAIIGAGPAGLFAARELADKGVPVAIFNRDVKPGGLAEYGIYPEKLRIKEGLRCQFRDIVRAPGVSYFGNVTVGVDSPLNFNSLRQLGFSAILVAAGAQGTKWLGLPGEDCPGVYHAKELVYHYNHLPPYACQEFPIGKKVMVVGVGNVMTDIVRWLLTLPQVEEITTIARRGLAEIKFDDRELLPVAAALDVDDFQREVERISPAMKWIGQVPSEAAARVLTVVQSVTDPKPRARWRMRFLYSPSKILSEFNHVTGIKLEENRLESTPTGTVARGTGHYTEEPLDTLIFAIGDQVDRSLGLPVEGSRFVLAETPHYPIGNVSYEMADTADHRWQGVFVCGWSRNASTGMVGIARRDGMNAARALSEYLLDRPEEAGVSDVAITAFLHGAGLNPVRASDLGRLEAIENDRAAAAALSEYKFDTNEEMLRVMGLLP